MKCFLALAFYTSLSFAQEEGPRDKLVKNAQRVEKAVLKDLGSLRDKGCRFLKNKDCVPEKETTEDKKKEESN